MRFRTPISIAVLVLVLVGLTSWLLRPAEPPSLSALPPLTSAVEEGASDAAIGPVERVDRAFEAHWKTNHLETVGAASDLLVARRIALGLMGTIPSMEEVRLFESWPESERIDRYMQRVLNDQRSANYLAERYARALVGVEPGPFLVYRRRRFVDWLSKRIHANTPHDELVRELVTATGTWTSEPESNFITATINQDADEEGPDEIKIAGRVARAFLGVRLDCVECHDDFLHDKWSQRNFHELASFFGPTSAGLSGVQNEDEPYEVVLKNSRGIESIPPAVPFHPELLPPADPDASGDAALRERLAVWITHPENRAFARASVNRAWAILFGRPLTTTPVDEVPLEAPFPPGLEVLADDFIAHDFDLHRLFRVMAATRAFRMDSQVADPDVAGDEEAFGAHVTPEQEEGWAAFPMTRLRPDQVGGAILQASSLETIDASAHVIRRLARAAEQGDFIKRFGDIGEDEFSGDGGTIPQRLVLMNGKLVDERTKKNLVMNAATRLAVLAKSDAIAVEGAYLAALSRRPSAEEATWFEGRLEGTRKNERSRELQDLYWALLNSTEFSWGH